MKKSKKRACAHSVGCFRLLIARLFAFGKGEHPCRLCLVSERLPRSAGGCFCCPLGRQCSNPEEECFPSEGDGSLCSACGGGGVSLFCLRKVTALLVLPSEGSASVFLRSSPAALADRFSLSFFAIFAAFCRKGRIIDEMSGRPCGRADSRSTRRNSRRCG